MSAGVDMVVVNYHTPADLQAFWRSYLVHAPEVDHTLTVVNVAANDEDISTSNGFSLFRGVSVVNTTENVGYSGACNTASTYGDKEVIAFFNADTELRPGVVDRCHQLR